MRALPTLAFVLVALALPGCDDTDVDMPAEDPGPPRLVKILIQSSLDSERFLATDLLEHGQRIECSDAMPCPASNLGFLPCPETPVPGATARYCPDPLDPAEAPPASDVGGSTIRLVFNKALDPAIETVQMDAGAQFIYHLAAGAVELDDATGQPPAGRIFYDPSGSATTTDLFGSPLGPAIVIVPDDPLAPGATYTIRIDPSKIRDRSGQALDSDLAGPIKNAYPFTIEALYPLAFSLRASKGVIAPNDVITLELNAAVDWTTLDVLVTNKAGNAQVVEVFPDQGIDSMECQPNTAKIDVAHALLGAATDWPEGDYTLAVTAVAAANGKQGLKTDAFGTMDFAATPFTVKGPNGTIDDDPRSLGNFVLPEACMAPEGPDMGLAEGADMAAGAGADLAAPDEAGAGPIDMAQGG